MSLMYPDDTLPDPTLEEAAIGWKISTEYLEKIAKLVGQDWERPTLETVQCVLLAHAAQQYRFVDPEERDSK